MTPDGTILANYGLHPTAIFRTTGTCPWKSRVPNTLFTSSAPGRNIPTTGGPTRVATAGPSKADAPGPIPYPDPLQRSRTGGDKTLCRSESRAMYSLSNPAWCDIDGGIRRQRKDLAGPTRRDVPLPCGPFPQPFRKLDRGCRNTRLIRELRDVQGHVRREPDDLFDSWNGSRPKGFPLDPSPDVPEHGRRV